jgi:hypothetical protein
VKTRLVGIVIVVILGPHSRQGQSQEHAWWGFELRASVKPGLIPAPKAFGSLELTDTLIQASRSWAHFELGQGLLGRDSIGPVPAPLVADNCVPLKGRALLFRQQDSLTIDFSPDFSDCGLLAQGVIRGDTIVGTWYQPRLSGYTGYAARGPFFMWRQR